MEVSEMVAKRDKVEERLKAFVRYAVEFTMEEAKEIRQVSLDKEKAKGVNIAPVSTVAAAVGTAGGIPGAKAGANIFKKGAEKQSKAIRHKRAKKLHKVFEGFDENDHEWQNLFIEAYVEFFINRNLQFLHILRDLEDSWENAMRKVAKDANHRLFNYLEVMVSNSQGQELVMNKQLIFQCLEKGSSSSSIMKTVLKRKLSGQGGTIKTRTEEHLTRKLFDRPVNINDVKCDDDIDKYLYRHTFGVKTEYPKVLIVYYLRIFDQYENLSSEIVKKNLIGEIQQVFKSNDKVIIEKIGYINDDVAQLMNLMKTHLINDSKNEKKTEESHVFHDETQMKELTKKFEDLEEHLKNMSLEDIARIEAAKKALEGEKVRLEAEIEKKKSELEEEKDRLATEKNKSEKERKTLEENNTKLSTAKNDIEKEKTTLDEENTKLANEKNIIEKEKKKLEEENDRLTTGKNAIKNLLKKKEYCSEELQLHLDSPSSSSSGSSLVRLSLT